MGKIKFTKMHGLGNDYIYIDVAKNKELREIFSRYSINAFVRYLSNRNFGIGSDGVIFIETSKIADFKMRIFNQDGTEAEICGNGIRCFAKYVYENKLTTKEIIEIETLAGVKKVRIIKNEKGEIDKVNVDMGVPKIYGSFKQIVLDKEFEITKVSIGNPHAVIFMKNIDEFPIEEHAKIIESSRHFPNKANVEFVEILEKNLIKIRVWERGSKETFACGSGSCAAVAAGFAKGLVKNKVKVLLRGGELEINLDESTKKIYMQGIATKVFDGIIEI